mgnify:CR=1 FL=1|tara:strand:+ start:1978 stop:2241 length:264 start_codon:yes stop_codon:yes gene_type:complete
MEFSILDFILINFVSYVLGLGSGLIICTKYKEKYLLKMRSNENLYENTQYLPSHIVTSNGPLISTPELVASAPVIEHNKPPLKITVQ